LLKKDLRPTRSTGRNNVDVDYGITQIIRKQQKLELKLLKFRFKNMHLNATINPDSLMKSIIERKSTFENNSDINYTASTHLYLYMFYSI